MSAAQVHLHPVSIRKVSQGLIKIAFCLHESRTVDVRPDIDNERLIMANHEGISRRQTTPRQQFCVAHEVLAKWCRKVAQD